MGTNTAIADSARFATGTRTLEPMPALTIITCNVVRPCWMSLDGDGANLGVAWWIITVVTPWYEKSEPSVVLSQGSVVAATSCLMGQGAAALRVGPRTRGHALWLLRAATVSVGPASSVKTRIHGPSGPIRTALPPPPTPRLVEGRGAATDPAPWGGVRPDSPAGGYGPSPSRQARAEIAPLAWP